MSLTIKQQDFIRRKENALSVERAIKLTENEIKEIIKKEGLTHSIEEKDILQQRIRNKTSILSGLVIIWSESLIKWLLYEHGAFEDEQIQRLLNRVNSQQWTGAITTAFWKAFSNQPYDLNNPLPKKNMIDNSTQISEKDKNRFNQLFTLIEKKLDPSIIIRNKIQHGEWVYSYKADEQSKEIQFDNEITSNVQGENILTLKLKRKQFKAIYQIIYDLAVFNKSNRFRINDNQTPFLFFFNKRYKQILANQREIDIANYEQYKEDLIVKMKRGGAWRRKNMIRKLVLRIQRKCKKKTTTNNA